MKRVREVKKRGDLSYSGTVAPPAAAAPGGVLGRREPRRGGKRREKKGREKREEREKLFRNGKKTGPEPLYRGRTGSVFFSLDQTGPVLLFWPAGLTSGPFFFFFLFSFSSFPIPTLTPLFSLLHPFLFLFFTHHIYFMSCIFIFTHHI